MHTVRLERIPIYRYPPFQVTPNNLPTLLYLRREYNYKYNCHLTSQQCAEAAQVPISVYYEAEIGALTDMEDALSILAAFSRLIGRRITLRDVYLCVRPVSIRQCHGRASYV